MKADDPMLGVSREISKAQLPLTLNQSVYRQKPRIAVQVRNTEVTEHNHVLPRRKAGGHLVRE
jgi:hypothetical protein